MFSRDQLLAKNNEEKFEACFSSLSNDIFSPDPFAHWLEKEPQLTGKYLRNY